MSPTSPHSAILRKSANDLLRPIGMFQKGRSRTWLGDHGWWMDVVEFQPSGFAKGSYLNVSCTWLWHVKPYISFDEGDIGESPFQKLETQEQFSMIAETLARTAKERVLRYRSRFPSARALSDFYLRKGSEDWSWRTFHAGVAHGICGRSGAALGCFSRFSKGLDQSIQWQKDAYQDVQSLTPAVQDTLRFRMAIADRVGQTRELLKLPSVIVDFETSSIA